MESTCEIDLKSTMHCLVRLKFYISRLGVYAAKNPSVILQLPLICLLTHSYTELSTVQFKDKGTLQTIFTIQLSNMYASVNRLV